MTTEKKSINNVYNLKHNEAQKSAGHAQYQINKGVNWLVLERRHTNTSTKAWLTGMQFNKRYINSAQGTSSAVRRDQEEGGKLDSQQSPEEIKSREVELDSEN